MGSADGGCMGGALAIGLGVHGNLTAVRLRETCGLEVWTAYRVLA